MSTSYDPRITAYFGDAVLRAGFVAVPHLLLRHYQRLGLSNNQAMFVLQLMESTWDLAEPPHTTGELAQRMGVDKRTIRRYSEEVAALGLLTLFDQFDEHGAQIGNGYDLSPLFARLAEQAPDSEGGRAPTRTPRPSRSRSAVSNSAPAADERCPPPRRTILSAPQEDNSVRPGADRTVRGTGIGRSRLNGITKNPNKQQEQLLHAAATASDTAASNGAGFSLGSGVALSAAEVATTHDVLAMMGIEQPVRGIIAPSLAPFEAWSLRAYALARRWRIGLVIAQVYDRATRRAKAAENVPAEFVELGRALTTLPPQAAEASLAELVDNAAGGAVDPPDVPPPLREAARTAWPTLKRLAGQPIRVDTTQHPPAGGEMDELPSALWAQVQEQLAGHVTAAEFETWLRPARLLALGEQHATIGAGNTFARDCLEARYRQLLESAMRRALGRELCVEVVIA